MPITKSSLSGKIKANLEGYFTTKDSAILQKVCDAIADAVVQEITTNAVVTVTAVTPGVGTASGTVT